MEKIAILRSDITNGFGVPLNEGEIYLYDRIPLKYRWIGSEDNEQFQVFCDGEWYNAYSIDFEFI